MDALIALFLLLLFAVIVVLPIWTIMKIGRLSREQESMQSKLRALEKEADTLRATVKNLQTAPPTQTAPSTPPAPAPTTTIAFEKSPLEPTSPIPASIPAQAQTPPTQVPAPAKPPVPASAPVLPPKPPTPAAKPPAPPKPSWISTINWEQFMGVKLFAWLGGIALALCVVYFIKYSLDQGWIPDSIRVAMGFIFGAALIVGGLKLSQKSYAVLSQSLIGTGILSLYAVTFACGASHYNFLGTAAMGLLMSLITATAFILAVRLEAQVVAILGILGGFLTPLLLSTGVDNPGGLFGYLALLDIGLIAVALHRRWFYLVPMGATGTVIMIIGWALKFYAPEKTLTAMIVCLGFNAVFIGIVEVARRIGRSSPLLAKTAMALPAVAFCFAIVFLEFPAVAAQNELLFGFVILNSAAVFLLAWRAEIGKLILAAAGVTTLFLARWIAEVFTDQQAPILVAVCLLFSALYFGVYLIARHLDRATPSVVASAVALPFVSLAFAYFLLDNASLSQSPALLFGFIFASDALLLALAWLDKRLPRLHLIAGLVVFALLSAWTTQYLTPALLPWALAVFLLFAALHTAFPLVLQRQRPNASPTWWSQLFPPLALLLMMLPLFKLDTISLLIWPAILLVDVIAIALALVSASLAAVAAVLVLTLFATGLCIFKVPVDAIHFAPSLLLIIGGFSVFFFAASIWLARKLNHKLPQATDRFSKIFGDARSQIPAFSSLLPFLLLIMVCLQLPIDNPSAVFGLGLLLIILTLGLAQLLAIEWLPACALAGITALEFAWHSKRFNPADSLSPLLWYIAFYALFAAYPFIFRKKLAKPTGPWAVAALSGLAHFWITYQAIRHGWPTSASVIGFVPALFALAPLASLAVILRAETAENPKRLNQLAWFGGIALLFITLIFPTQFANQPEWLTIAWALEGAALLWLFIRVPHPGLRATGSLLLVVAFARLALNPAILSYHLRGDTPILNWYLYAYGLTTAALFIAARLAAPPRDRLFGLQTPPVFNTLGAILAFILLNIEIADFFTEPGSHSLVFTFSGNLARDMTYTIAWALFALALLTAGIAKKQRLARYAAITLLSVALLKLFFRDLRHLETLYLVGALFVVGVIAFIASFAYQRFLPNHDKNQTPKP